MPAIVEPAAPRAAQALPFLAERAIGLGGLLQLAVDEGLRSTASRSQCSDVRDAVARVVADLRGERFELRERASKSARRTRTPPSAWISACSSVRYASPKESS
jgi:hypothetical protein